MTKHTPGPWNMQDQTQHDWHGGFRIAAKDNCCLAIVGHVDAKYKDQAEANARLMKTAPELLEALEICKDALADHVQYDDGTSLERDGFDAARAAIAKATA